MLPRVDERLPYRVEDDLLRRIGWARQMRSASAATSGWNRRSMRLAGGAGLTARSDPAPDQGLTRG
ncbi:hypothetical protein [Streptosporangium sp. NPDC087985]|uniref:hypothetical protein n=1 Tax=Streptosporangium sp. NPDC087985 TaxID=3366196 RepID=UPI003816742D